ncbi:phosphohistidine phosphatase SixA [Gilvimarinus sp. SDUM040013]|uniref:Phosphohistidine phosphatase SixA n=1 Tax=Gilvimarinus gilvus TaxID=3058038 RepID=A0ABU4RZN4_9GAMM|nr:phosphohistidine phosphatase SixA [Gilvimarinus sp. SDUM040013]MDO3386460.1 phosphohistidine phosphatase SixA [Gilvimarinus sp. SDUM040013]MDX6849726.1 phosphohistidine phosphatase SixA [Gilvimarinus sp. SDUM040013]
MHLFILRHGRAEPYRGDDASRELVASGRKDVHSIVQRQKSYLNDVAIWSSPYVRALQTAEIAAHCLGLPTSPDCITANLTPDASVQKLLREIYQSELTSLLIVSHQPLVGDLLQALCTQAQPSPMKTASMAGLTLEIAAADFGQLDWLVHP